MVLDYKGFTEEEIQKLIDWKDECRKIDEIMWKQNAEVIIRKIIYQSLKEEPIGKPTKTLEECKKDSIELEGGK